MLGSTILIAYLSWKRQRRDMENEDVVYSARNPYYNN